MRIIPDVVKPSSIQTYVVHPICKLSLKIYETYFYAMKGLVEGLSKRGYREIGVLAGMMLTETPAVLRALAYTIIFRKQPKWEPSEGAKHVLLMHGALGNCRYMHDLATYLEKRGIKVSVIDTGTGEASNEKWKQVFAKVVEIRESYLEKGVYPKIDIVAHSMGGYQGLFSMFANPEIKEGKVTNREELRPQGMVGKLITLAMPLDQEEADLLRRVDKLKDTYNINAKYDALMGHKTPALDPQHNSEVSAGHIGIIYNQEAFTQVADIIRN